MPNDQAQSILAPLQIDNSLKADAWEAFNSAQNETDLQVKLMGMKDLPQSAKADLWEAKKSSASQIPNASQQAQAMFQPTGSIGSQVQFMPGPSSNRMTPQQEQYINERLPLVQGRVNAIRKGAIEAGGAALGAGAVSGSGALANILRIAGAGAGGAAGNVAGNVVTGQTPTAGEAAKSGATMAAGEGAGLAVGSAVGKFGKWLTASKGLGASMLNEAVSKAGNAPVKLSPETDKLVEQITAQGKLGGSVPKVVSDLLERVGPTTKVAADAEPGPLTYKEARILYGNVSELSAEEQMKLKGQLKWLMPALAKSFGKDVQAAADAAGVGPQHTLGMQQYAMAASRGRVIDRLGELAMPTIKGALGGGAGAAAGYEIYRILKGQR